MHKKIEYTLNPLEVTGSSNQAWKQVREYFYTVHNGCCEVCGNKVKPQFEIHHKNGCGLDNRLENLQLLCDACHGDARARFKHIIHFDNPILHPAILKHEYASCFPRAVVVTNGVK
jgi:5-methylcytosine-specific restriction endonuclease McrA